MGSGNMVGRGVKKWGYHFHYEEFWDEHEECAKTIKRGLAVVIPLGGNLAECKKRLQIWSKNMFKGRMTTLHNLKSWLAILKKNHPRGP